MRVATAVGLLLIVLGLLGLVYGGFRYTEDTHDIELGPIEFEVKEKERVSVPMWLSVGGIVAGVVLVALDRRGRG